MWVEDQQYINQDGYEFDVFIKSSESSFELTSYQVALHLKGNFVNTDSIQFLYIPGTSDLSNIPRAAVSINLTGSKVILTFGSFPGSDIIEEDILRVGRFKVKDRFNQGLMIKLNLSWVFQGSVSTILTGAGFGDITDPDNHFIVNTINPNKQTIKSDDDYNEIIEFGIQQNYPNPFNPFTTVEFSIKEESNVKLILYSLLGEELKVIVNDVLDTGIYKRIINGSDLPSGVYFYSLKINDNVISTRKMVLLR
jgi:hypothetical protein